VRDISEDVEHVEFHGGLLHRHDGDTARAPVAWDLRSESQSQDQLPGRSTVRPGMASGWCVESPGRCRWVLVKAG
jgi:hypothetical protein